jgi:flagellar biosynthesis/type III secretory pathway protein FliH
MATKPVFDDVPAWPEAKAARGGMGHNKPPLEELIPAEFRAALLADRPEFMEKLEGAVASADRVVVTDDEALGKLGDLVNIYRALIKHVTETHKVVKAPHLEAGRLVDAERNALVDRVEDAKRRAEAIGNDYVAKREARLRAERERQQAEERAAAERAATAERERLEAERAAERAAKESTSAAERAEAEERAEALRKASEEAMSEAALAAAQQRKVEPVRSDAGAAVSGRQEWTSQVEDYSKAFRAVKDDPKVRAEIDKAVQRLVKAGKREMPGVRIWPVAKASFR